MRVAAHVIEHLLRSRKRRFGIDGPFGFVQRSDVATKLVRVPQLNFSSEPKKRSLPESKAFSRPFRNRRRKNE